MNRCVTLTGTGIQTSALGFGCASLLGDQTPAEGTQLLNTAYDAGIRYFDVARSYGYGEAEALLGKFARGKRDHIAIATKFGIVPMIPIAGSSAIRSAVRNAMRLSPAIRRFLGRRAANAVRSSRFGVKDARTSLERSLRTLETDFIDVFLLHECRLADLSDELLEFLREVRSRGLIRCFGVTAPVEEVTAICRERPQFADVLQVQSSVVTPHTAIIEPPGAVVTYGALSSYQSVLEYLSRHHVEARAWRVELAADPTDPATLSALMLNHAVSGNRRGPVLFHSRRAENISRNVRSVDDEPFSSSQLEKFAQLAGEALRPKPY